MNPDTPNAAIAFGTIAAFGVGGINVAGSTVALIVVPDALLATSAALALAIRTGGAATLFAVYSSIFSNKLKTRLPETVAQYAVKAGLPISSVEEFVKAFLTEPTKLTAVPGSTPQIAAAARAGSRLAYAYALKYVWYSTIPFGVIGIGCCFFFPSLKKYNTNRVAIKIG